MCALHVHSQCTCAACCACTCLHARCHGTPAPPPARARLCLTAHIPASAHQACASKSIWSGSHASYIALTEQTCIPSRHATRVVPKATIYISTPWASIPRVGAQREANHDAGGQLRGRHHLDDPIVHGEGRVEEDSAGLGREVHGTESGQTLGEGAAGRVGEELTILGRFLETERRSRGEQGPGGEGAGEPAAGPGGHDRQRERAESRRREHQEGCGQERVLDVDWVVCRGRPQADQ
mmetsp:Transcript_9432/g.31336  ORF Transcript_9432/g.31336 Transcript_9432/m.31336 type:complete len:237 (+) Transcript_9432:439-1149(+)|eukprot:scaffold21967_cov114-Isochrysis_galbana.AAC.4